MIISAAEIQEYIEHYIAQQAATKTVEAGSQGSAIHQAAIGTKWPSLLVRNVDVALATLDLHTAIMNTWLTGMAMGIECAERARELAELKRIEALAAER